MICAGIDGGSRAIKVVLIDRTSHTVLASGVREQGVEHDALAARLMDELLHGLGVGRGAIQRIVATGYTRHRISMATSVATEITCHAAGVRHLVPEAMTVIDIGGQDSKLLRLDVEGRVWDFMMNDRCAAGTGRFLEVVAERLGFAIAAMGDLASRSLQPAPISSTCVVFAESELIGLLVGGTPREDILAGVQAAIAARVATMAQGRVDEPIVLSGGVGLVPGMDAALSRALQRPVTVAPDPQVTGALGAALLAAGQAS